LRAERAVAVLVIAALAVACAAVLLPFFTALLSAALLAFTTWPAVPAIERWTKSPRPVTASLLVTITALFLIGPVALAAPSGASEVSALRHSFETWLASVPAAPAWLGAIPVFGGTLSDTWNAWAGDISQMGSFFRPYLGLAAERGLSLLLGVAGGLLQVFLTLFATFCFWLSGEALGTAITNLVLRVAGRHGPRVLAVATRAVRGTVFGILGTAVIQGFLTAAGLAIAGVPRPLLLGLVAAFLAVLPIGAPLVWIPAGLWLMSGGHGGAGAFLLIYGVIVVSGADHIIRPYFIARGARIPFVLVVFGALGGVLAFGVPGLVLGPVLLGLGFALLSEWAKTGSVVSA